MARETNETFSARRVDIVLNGVPAAVEVHFDAAMANGLVRAHAEIPRLRGMGVRVGYSRQGDLLKVTVTGRSRDISVKDTGNATVVGDGVAVTGVSIGNAAASVGGFTEADASEAGNYDGVAKGWLSVHHDMMPKITLRLYYGSEEPLLYRITG